MSNIFVCPKCKNKLDSFKCTICGYEVPCINSIYQFCSDAPVKLDGENQYIGYDGIGEDFEPAVIYWDANNTERYGVYKPCGDLITKKFGKGITVLDLGAGLGTASIPLAKNGIYTIAADISNVMLSTAVKRANGRFDNLICARMNAYELMLADNSVDIVVENAMLHLVSNPESVIREIKRVLKHEGYLVRYGSYPLPLNEEEAEKNAYCNAVLSDISDFYYNKLTQLGYKGVYFDNHANDYIG
ncbi:MAG: class I SAM-dependent methyltransferase, partial [Eubacteriales bacterium]|nr:class I SAM-dependent methyltransferase [Eubacteriales bacterium]